MRPSTRSPRLLTAAGGIVLSTVLAVGLAAAPAYAQGAILGAGHPEAVSGSYLVALKPQAATRGVPAHAADLASRFGGSVDFIYDAALTGFSVRMSERAAKQLAAHPLVDYVEQDIRVRLQGTQHSPPSWGLDRVDERAKVLDDTYTYPNLATYVNVYILDTGVRLTHQDFGGRAHTGFDAITSGGAATDCNGHGTHVAGIAAGAAHGVAKHARIFSVRVLNCEASGTTSQVVAGVNWVTSHALRPAVANLSLGMSGTNTSVNNAVAHSIAAGITYVVAAGNTNADACNVSPAKVPTAITVAATTSSDNKAIFSNYGTCVDLFAPGQAITSAWYTSNTATHSTSGTSQAAPHVTGAAAMVLSDHPSWSPTLVKKRLLADATTGVVGFAGSGSPNRLLYAGTGGSPPIVTAFHCESGSGTFICDLAYHSNRTPITITWRVNGSVVSNWTNQSSVWGGCTTSTTVRATVTNPYGSGSSTTWGSCQTGPWM